MTFLFVSRPKTNLSIQQSHHLRTCVNIKIGGFRQKSNLICTNRARITSECLWIVRQLYRNPRSHPITQVAVDARFRVFLTQDLPFTLLRIVGSWPLTPYCFHIPRIKTHNTRRNLGHEKYGPPLMDFLHTTIVLVDRHSRIGPSLILTSPVCPFDSLF